MRQTIQGAGLEMIKNGDIRILLVEDDPIHAKIMRRAFSASQPEAEHIVHVSDGESALDFVFGRGQFADHPWHAQPDLVLLDIRLPAMDGFGVLSEVRKSAEKRGIPVVMVSTSDTADDVRRSYEMGANAYLAKSGDFRDFSESLSLLYRFWSEAAKLPPRQN